MPEIAPWGPKQSPKCAELRPRLHEKLYGWRSDHSQMLEIAPPGDALDPLGALVQTPWETPPELSWELCQTPENG